LFIDFNNISSQFVGGGFAEAVQGWLAWLEDGGFDPRGQRRRFIEKRVFLSMNYGQYAPVLEAAGFLVVPSAADSIIGYDIADTIHVKKPIAEYVVLTVDSGFDHVLERLGERGRRRVVTIKPGEASAKSFPLRSEVTITIEELRKAFTYERKNRFGARLSRAAGWVRARASHGADLASEGLARLRQSIPRGGRNTVLIAVADHVAKLALEKPGVPAGFKTVKRYLEKNMPEFHVTGRYAGCGTFNKMIREVAAIRPDLQVVRTRAGLAIMAP
jgi:hypothetical protein